MTLEIYFQNLKNEIDKVYSIANSARAKGYDPVNEVEIPLAMSMAEKVVGLISTIYSQVKDSGIAERILELEKEYGKLDPTILFKISEEVAKQKFCKFENLIQAMDAGIRIAFAYTTLGVVSSPIEGFTGIKTRKTRDGKEYIEASFSGPIRSAGTTASCIILIVIDYLREVFGFAKYDPTPDEIKRLYTELEHFHERVNNLQYMPTEQEALFLAEHLPIQIAGDASETIEVPNYKNLERVGTNFLRSGFCLVIGEGLAQKAAKGFRLLNKAKKNGIASSGFDFLEEYIKIHEKRDRGKADASPVYIKDLVAGRPIFGHPSRSGGFRFRYGRGRVSGFSAASLHPATMAISDNFIAIGTQLKIEKPTKGCAVTVCDSIDGPIVKMFNGSVKKITSIEEAKKIYPDVDEIIYFGDILFPFSDLANRNANLIKPGYVEEWWHLEAIEKDSSLESLSPSSVSLDKAIEISKNCSIPMHPEFIFYWTQISKDSFLDLLKWIENSKVDKKIIFPYNKAEKEKFSLGKRALEILGVEHQVTLENVVLTEETSAVLLLNLGIGKNNWEEEKFKLNNIIDYCNANSDKSVLEIVNYFSEYTIKDKAGEFIGSRMGRPEKAKLRKLVGSPNVLFPVGKEGGRLRSLQSACKEGRVFSSFPLYHCEKCESETIYPTCEKCSSTTKQMYYFPETKEKLFTKLNEASSKEGIRYTNKPIDINHYYEHALKNLGYSKDEAPLLIKGVRGTSSANHAVENLSKGILRSKYNLQVNKDGTIRFDATELPLLYFKPKEAYVSIKKLREIGYTQDIFGKDLEREDQILELMPHDILLPSSFESLDEKADEVFFRVSQFVDEELEGIYGLEKLYNLQKKEDLIGKLGVCMAPHNCAGVICRFVGFSNTQGLFASPYMHAAVRRDCDGDEAAIMLLGDVLLNFSREFLPSHRGGTQDAPLVLNAKIDAGEVDDQILDFEFVSKYPLELYKLAEKGVHSSEVKINTVKEVLKRGDNPFINAGFTHDTENFNEGVLCSSYKLLLTMKDKVNHQMNLVEKLRAVDTSDTARLIIDRHFIRDMRGNLRKFSMQEFRCVGCNEIIRRVPLNGVCPTCKGKLIFTIHEGGIKKYLEPALGLAKKYNLPNYVQQNLELVKRYVESIFGKEIEKQESISKWF